MYYPRNQWTTYDPGWTPMGQVSDVFIHHTVTDTVDVFDAQFMRNIEQVHINLGDGAIAYHRVVFGNGDVGEGRPWATMGAATYTWNNRSYAIVLPGNFNNDIPTEAQISQIVDIIKNGIEKGFISANPTIRGHRDAPNNSTACPGNNLEDRLNEISIRVNTPDPVVVTPKRRNSMFIATVVDTGKVDAFLVEGGVRVHTYEGALGLYGIPQSALDASSKNGIPFQDIGPLERLVIDQRTKKSSA